MSASGYVRQSASSIAGGQPVSSTPVNNEFNQLQAAFSGTSGHDHSGGTGLGPGLGTSAFGGLTSASTGVACANGANSFNCRTITGTSNRLTVTNGDGLSANPTLDISASYVGQTTITTLGTIATGTWNATVLGATYGGTGVNNASNTITLAGNLVTSGAFPITLTSTASTNVTLPTSGTLVNTTVTTLSSLASIGTVTTGTWHGSVIAGTYGGTGVNNGAFAITLGGNLTTSGAFSTTITATNTTTVTLPTSGTLLANSNNLSDVSSVSTARTNILPSQTGNASKFLTTDGAGTVTWGSVSGASGGTVTSVTFTGDGTVLSSSASSAVTGSGTVTAALANATGGTVLCNTSSSSAAPTYSAAPVHGVNGTTTGKVILANGNVSGASVTIQNSDCTVAYNFRLPATAGSSTQVLTSAGGASAMTWTTPTTGTVTSVAGDGTVISGTITTSGSFSLASATAKSVLGNTTSGSAAPTYTTAPVVSGQITAASFKASSTSGVIGTTTNDSAAAGSVGEYISSTVADNTISMTSTNPINITSISLTAGDWDVFGVIRFSPAGGTTQTQALGGISTTTGTLPGTTAIFANNSNMLTAADVVESTPLVRASLSGTTTYFLVAQATFSGSTLAAGGILRARRVR